MGNYISDSYTMFKRSMTRTLRSPEAIVVAIILPVFMMVMFGYVFGGVVDLGDINYINFIVPGIIVQCVLNASAATAFSIYTDMTTGIIDRFRSMSISKASLITGHVCVSVIRSIVITIFTFGAAFAIGFRPEASFTDWLLIAAILILFMIAITWMVVIFGLISKDAESINGTSFLLMIFVFISSAFSPPETLPTVLRVFAQNQPITHIVDAMRALMLGFELSGWHLVRALAWCLGLGAVCFAIAVQVYKSKLTR